METGAPAPPPFTPDALALDGDWELAWGEKGQGPSSEWRRVRVPGSAHTQWLDQSKWYTREANWISSKEWWHRKRFRVPERYRSKRLRLEFDATDYYAEAWLNGVPIGRHEGYIDPYEYDVTKFAKPGAENELLIRIWTPVTYYWRHRPYTVKGAYGAVDQKPDDITPLGITRGVRLVASSRAAIRDVAVDTRLAGDGAQVEVQVEADGPGSWELTLRPRNFSSPERYRIRGSGSRFVFRLDQPRLWWTWDHGKPNLYSLDVRLLDGAGKAVDGRTLAVGIREIEKIGWIFYLNRRRIFIRGTNYYYNLFLSEMNRAAYQRDFQLMLGMNVNMIRLHCHFTNPEFYDLADESGVLVWQDYLEAWYPHDRDFSLRAAALYDNHIRYVRNHASVALWATSDEEDLENYRDLTKHLAPRPFALDPQRRAVVRSTGRYGDAHVYHGWYGGSIWEYARMKEAFVSELGATSLPNYETLVKFLPNHWPIKDHAGEWVFRKLQIPEAMRAWGEPGTRTLEEYIPHTQEYVARLFQLALERSRRLKYNPAGGILHFHAIDIWPSVTMAAVDFYRVPTKVYETVKRSFSPVLVSFEYDRDRWRPGETFRCGLWVVNDLAKAFPGARLSWRLEGPDGRVRAKGGQVIDVGPDCVLEAEAAVAHPDVGGRWRLLAEVRSSDGNLLTINQLEFVVEDAKNSDSTPSR
jgi:beta-mannosidase